MRYIALRQNCNFDIEKVYWHWGIYIYIYIKLYILIIYNQSISFYSYWKDVLNKIFKFVQELGTFLQIYCVLKSAWNWSILRRILFCVVMYPSETAYKIRDNLISHIENRLDCWKIGVCNKMEADLNVSGHLRGNEVNIFN